jgi:hypothetical protein
MRPICFRTEYTQVPAMHISNPLRKATTLVSAVVLMVFSGGLFDACSMAQTAAPSVCPNSTVADAWGPEFAAEAKTFFLALQHVVKNNNEKGFAALVQYPLNVYGAGTFKIRTPAEMIRKYASIMTPGAREAILDQSPDCLFGNGQGVMAASGRVWFQKQPDGKMKVITLNMIRPK